MKKLLIILAILIMLLAAGLAVTWWWLTDTRSGAEWSMNRAVPYLDELTWDSIQGSLASGLTIRGLSLEQAGTRVSVDEIELTARIRPLAGPTIDVERLYVRSANVYLPETEPRDEPPDPFDPGLLDIPVAININDLRVETFRLHPHGGEPLVLDRLRFAGHYSDHIRIDRLEAAAPQGSLEGSGQWALTEPFDTRLDLQALLLIGEDTEQTLDLEIRGPLASLEVGFDARGPATASGIAQVRGLPDMPSGSIRLDGQLADWSDLDLALDDISLHTEGTINDWSLTLDTRVSGMDLPPSRWQIEASGDLIGVDVHSLRGDVLDGEVTATGWFEYGAEKLGARIELEMHELDFTALYPEWPQQAKVSGHLSGRISGEEFHLDRLDLIAPPTDLKLSGSGRFVPTTDELALNLEWQDLVWPPLLEEAEPLVSSQSGRVRLTGRISDWRLELDALLSAPDVPAGELGLRATGNDERADIERLTLDLGDAGRMAAQGRFGWAPAIDTRLDLELHQVDPGRIVAQLPGRIDARASIDVRRGERWQIGLELTELEGRLRDNPLSGSGRVRMADEVPEAARLDVSLGENRLELASEDGERWQWRLDANALAELWPDISGMALLEGTIEPYARTLNARGELEAAGFGDFSVQWVHLDTALNWGEVPHADIKLRLNDLDLNPWDRIEQLELGVEGGCADHRLELYLSGLRGSLDLAGRGTLDGCLAHAEAWQGQVERLYLGETVAGNWQLAESLPIRVTDEATVAGPGCLRAVGDDGRLCLRELRIDGNSHARISIHKMPMDLLLLPLDPVFTLTTPLSGQLDAAWGAAGLTQVTGYLELESGALRALGGEDDLLTIEQVRLDLTPEGDHGLLLDLLARLEGDSELTSQAHVIDLRDPTNTMINADARLDLPDIGAFNHLVAELDQLGGRLHGQINLAGSLVSPSVNGRMSLSDGFITHAPLGLRVIDIGIDLQGAADHATLVGKMRSGDGRLGLDGALTQRPDGWQMEANIEGSRFSFADVDWMNIEASPKIRLEGNTDRLDIDGDIRIDRLRGGLPPGAGERIRPSGDVVVLGETVEEDDELPIRRLYGRLGIRMGNDARLSAVGLQAQLAGGLELLWNGSPEPRGRGAILIPEGSYRAYGQNLAIRDGEILFTGHPLDNPRLDIRAVRDIFGDPRVEAAGVHIRGPAQKPMIDLFTNPPTTDEKALAYVVTGADFDHAAGQAAVNVGFYLLPRLFVSYGIGLFEAGNVLSGRYELSDRWGVRVVSGERDTGVDLGYIKDR
jgi:translocation and assembly module TamB